MSRKEVVALSFDAFFSSIISGQLKKVAAHWNDARADRSMPGWHDIRPSAVAAQLPLIWVYRYDRDADSFTGRLAGDAIERIFGKSFRGTPMKELYPQTDYARLFGRAKRVICEPAFYHGHGTVFRHVDRYGEGERIMMPLAEDGLVGDGVLGATIYDTHHGVPKGEALEDEYWFSFD